MKLLTESDQLSAGEKVRRLYRSKEELAIRDALERVCRLRWPEARLVHELVMGRGSVRADLAAVAPNHLAAFEIKGPHDDTTRLINQVAMYRLAVPEVWMVVAAQHRSDGDMVRYLLPSVGLAVVHGLDRYGESMMKDGVLLEVVAEAAPVEPHPEALLSLLWVSELVSEAGRARIWQGNTNKPPSHAKLVEMMKKLGPAEKIAAVCRQLRSRQAQWRADPAVPLAPWT